MYEMTLADCLFMKKHRFLFLASLMALVLLGGMAVVACSNNFKHVIALFMTVVIAEMGD